LRHASSSRSGRRRRAEADSLWPATHGDSHAGVSCPVRSGRGAAAGRFACLQHSRIVRIHVSGSIDRSAGASREAGATRRVVNYGTAHAARPEAAHQSPTLDPAQFPWDQSASVRSPAGRDQAELTFPSITGPGDGTTRLRSHTRPDAERVTLTRSARTAICGIKEASGRHHAPIWGPLVFGAITYGSARVLFPSATRTGCTSPSIPLGFCSAKSSKYCRAK